MGQIVTSVEHLKEEAKKGNGSPVAFYVSLSPKGLLRLTRWVEYLPCERKFNVLTEGNISWEEGIVEQDLDRRTDLVDAIRANRFYKW